jgi:hypothetical protein
MSDDELERIVSKARSLRELRRAKDRVNQLERKLRGEPARPEKPPYIPEFLRLQASRAPATLTGIDVTPARCGPIACTDDHELLRDA